MQINRLASIDSLRAITMLLMIWVNDFWSLKDIPKWLQHAEYGEDYLGFSDIIFPLFLFIVGLSIPLAIDSRLQKEASLRKVYMHVLSRSIALIIIGLFMVNYQTIHDQSVLIPRLSYCLLLGIAVLLIWMDWKNSPLNKRWNLILKITGYGLLIFLAIIYRGGETMVGNPWSHRMGLLRNCLKLLNIKKKAKHKHCDIFDFLRTLLFTLQHKYACST